MEKQTTSEREIRVNTESDAYKDGFQLGRTLRVIHEEEASKEDKTKDDRTTKSTT